MIRRIFPLACISSWAIVSCGNNGHETQGVAGPPGAGAALRLSQEPAGANCAHGGQRVEIGVDDGAGEGTAMDGILDDGEVDQMTFLCNGAPGGDGSAGVEGAPGGDGSAGVDGTPGVDGNAGGAGGAGPAGEDGSDGKSSLLAISTERPGVNCGAGGQRVAVGQDNGDGTGIANDGILQDDEIDQSAYVCNGAGPLPVPNASFEEPLSTGGVQEATGWTANGGDVDADGGVSGLVGFTAVAHGSQYYWLNLTSFSGKNPSYTESNPQLIGNATVGTYTLTVAVGRRNNDATTDGSVTIEVLADGVVIGSKTVADPFNAFSSDSFNDVSAVAVVAPGDAAIGGDITIRLTATDGTGGIRGQGQFDDVRLDYRP